MTSFNEREKSFEKKFAMDEEARFKADSRRNRMLAHWVAGKLGFPEFYKLRIGTTNFPIVWSILGAGLFVGKGRVFVQQLNYCIIMGAGYSAHGSHLVSDDVSPNPAVHHLCGFANRCQWL